MATTPRAVREPRSFAMRRARRKRAASESFLHGERHGLGLIRGGGGPAGAGMKARMFEACDESREGGDGD